jgi:phosphoglycerate dehydrogenase-like enzyme
MRVHVHTGSDDPAFAITPAQWHDAATRAGEPLHDVSFGTARADWDAVRAETELLIGSTPALRALRPLEAASLRLVFVNAAGVDGLAPFDWLPADAMLLNNRGTHAPKAGEFIAMAVLMLAARMPAMATAQRAGRWQPEFAAPLAGRAVTIVGTGDLGSAGARTLRLLGVRVTGVRSSATPHPDFAEVIAVAELDAVLARSEFLVLACPLTAATRGLLDRRRLALLPTGAGVVNIGRGALLHGEALCDALESGHLSGAVLDVFDPEPLPDGHRMWRTPNLVITPHVSCDDPAGYNARSLGILFANLRALRDGAAAPNRVDLVRGY